MSVRSWNLAATAAAFIVTPTLSSAPPAPFRYKVTTQLTQELDATALGGPKQSVSTKSDVYISVTLADTAGGRTVQLVVDSMVIDTAGNPQVVSMAKAQADSIKGAAFRAYLPKDGKITGLKAMKDGMRTQMVDGLLMSLFPGVKSGLKVGDAWTDTTNSTSEIPGGALSTSTVTAYKATGQAQGREKAFNIEGTSSASVSGTQQQATIEGSGKADHKLVVLPDGRTVSGTSTSNTSLQIVVPQAPEPIPMTMQTTTTITPLT